MKFRAATIAGYWIKAAWPVVVAVGGAAILFRSAVVSSIVSTPHPELVYLIFFTLFIGVFLTLRALGLFIKEENLLLRWRTLPHQAREKETRAIAERSAFGPLYTLLVGQSSVSARYRQGAARDELIDAQKYVNDKLTLPGYLGGALIGLGLVGTFIGLLGTLQELGTLFSSLLNTGSATMSAADMFGDMLRKLQAPLKGMGTAFVASLYGLLGSLLLGLVVMSVRKMGHKLVAGFRQSLRDEEYRSLNSFLWNGEDEGTEVTVVEADRWRSLFEDLQERHRSLMNVNVESIREFREVLKALSSLEAAIEKNNEIAERAQIQMAVSESRWLEAWDQMSSQLRLQRSESETGQHRIAQSLEELANLSRAAAAADVRLEGMVASAVQVYRDSEFDSVTSNRELVDSLQACRFSFEEFASKSRMNSAQLFSIR